MSDQFMKFEFEGIRGLSHLVDNFATDLDPLANVSPPESSSIVVDQGVRVFMERYSAAVNHVMSGMRSHSSSIASAVDAYLEAESSIADLER